MKIKAMCLVACGLSLSVGQALAQTTDKIIQHIEVVPFHNDWGAVDPVYHPWLKKIVQISTKERDRLLNSKDPKERSIGIFVADQQGDIKCLFSLSYLLGDKELAVLRSSLFVPFPPYHTEKQTVAGCLEITYQEWFGPVGSSTVKSFEKTFADVKNPNYLIYPWVTRLNRARGDAAKIAQIKQQVSKLPENVRTVVIVEGYWAGAYKKEEARKLLSKLSRNTQSALSRQEGLLSNDPLYQKDTDWEWFYKTVKRIMEPEP